MEENKIAVIDIETTDVSHQIGKIVEVGIVELDLTTGEVEPLLNFVTYEDGITKWMIENSWIINNSSLSVKQIRYGVNFERIKNTIQMICNTYKVTAFNKAFDFGYLRSRGVVIENELWCPMVELTDIIKCEHKNDYCKANYGKYKFPKVEEAWKYFFPEQEYVELHRAYDDAWHEAKIIHQLHLLKLKENVE